MTPCRSSPVEPIEICFRNVTGLQKIIVLFGSRDGDQDVERSDIRMQSAEDIRVLADALRRVLRKADDVFSPTGNCWHSSTPAAARFVKSPSAAELQYQLRSTIRAPQEA